MPAAGNLEPHANIRWRTAIPGVGWSSPIVSENTIFLTSVIRPQDGEAPKPGLYFGGERPAPSDEHRWIVVAVDFDERTNSLAAGSASRRAAAVTSSEEQLRLGDPDHRRRARLRALRQRRPVCLHDGRHAGMAAPAPARATRNGWGTAASPVLHDGRLYVLDENEEQSSLAAIDARTGNELWRVERPEGDQLGDAVRLASRAANRDRGGGDARRAVLRSEGRVLWTLRGMSSIAIPTPFESGGLLYVASGYVGDQVRPVYAIKPGAAATSRCGKGETATRLSPGRCRRAALQPVADRLRRHLLHAARSRLSHRARCAHRPGGVRPSADRSGRRRFHRLAVGGQRPALPAERGRRHLRHPRRVRSSRCWRRTRSARWRWRARPSPAVA